MTMTSAAQVPGLIKQVHRAICELADQGSREQGNTDQDLRKTMATEPSRSGRLTRIASAGVDRQRLRTPYFSGLDGRACGAEQAPGSETPPSAVLVALSLDRARSIAIAHLILDDEHPADGLRFTQSAHLSWRRRQPSTFVTGGLSRCRA